MIGAEHFVVFAWGFVPAACWLAYWITMDMWRERWNGKIRGEEHDSDLEAFVSNFVDDSTPTVVWWKVFVTPFIIGAAVSVVWWTIYVTVVLV